MQSQGLSEGWEEAIKKFEVRGRTTVFVVVAVAIRTQQRRRPVAVIGAIVGLLRVVVVTARI